MHNRLALAVMSDHVAPRRTPSQCRAPFYDPFTIDRTTDDYLTNAGLAATGKTCVAVMPPLCHQHRRTSIYVPHRQVGVGSTSTDAPAR